MAANEMVEVDVDGMGLPVANKENKLLQAEVQRKQKVRNELDRNVAEYNERINAMREHTRNVRQELQYTQGLYEARRTEMETEKHLKQIAEREDGRLNTEIKRISTEIQDLKEKMNSYENNSFRSNKNIEKLKQEMKWDQQTLDVWLEQTTTKEEEVIMVQKYAQADQSRTKDMHLKQERLLEIKNKKQKTLDSEVTETLTSQIEFDKTAEAFRRSHAEREDLIKQWEQTISMMKKRDADMDHLATELAKINVETRLKDDLVKEKNQFLEGEIENNAEKEKTLNLDVKQRAKRQNDYQSAEDSRTKFKDQLETLKYTLSKVSTDLDSTRAQVTQLGRELNIRKERLENLQQKRSKLDEELLTKTECTFTAESRAEEMDRLLVEEETRIAQLSKELDKLQEKEFKKVQELAAYKQKEQSYNNDIQGSKATVRNLTSKQNKVDNEALKQQEILYTQDFQLQQLEHRMARLQGERSDDEKLQLQARIKELEAEWEGQQSSAQLLQHQLKRLQDDLRKVSRQLDGDRKEKAINTRKIEELNLHIDSSQRELRKVVAAKQNTMVDENLIKLEVKKLRDTLFGHSDGVLTLEQRKLQLQTAMTERVKEVGIHKEMLCVQKKAVETERQAISTELHERFSKIDKLRKRYEIISVVMEPPEGEEGHSQAYYVIKAGQESQELQTNGDILDTKIMKAEKEISALENTLRLMNKKNETYRKSLNKVDSSGNEMVELEMMEGQLKATTDKLRRKRKLIRELQQDLQSMSNTLQNLSSDNSNYFSFSEEIEVKIIQRQKEIEEQKLKVERVSKQYSKLVKEVKAKKGKNAAEESDIDLRELRDFNVNITQQLSHIGAQQPELFSPMQLLFTQAGLPPPSISTIGSRASSQQSSPRSSVVSRASSRSTPSTLVHRKTLDTIIGLTSEPSTPKSGGSRSQQSSRSSTYKKQQHTSRSSSKQSSSRQSSVASNDLGLFIGPSH